jgi:hypothetical protein
MLSNSAKCTFSKGKTVANSKLETLIPVFITSTQVFSCRGSEGTKE